MTREEKAFIYFKDLRARKFKDYSSVFDTAPKDSVVYEAVSAEIEIYDTTIKALEQTKWIPVTERLPEEVKTKGYGLCNVLVTHKYAGITRTSFAVFDKGKFYTNNNFKHEDTSVIAWKPLPESYQVENEE